MVELKAVHDHSIVGIGVVDLLRTVMHRIVPIASPNSGPSDCDFRRRTHACMRPA